MQVGMYTALQCPEVAGLARQDWTTQLALVWAHVFNIMSATFVPVTTTLLMVTTPATILLQQADCLLQASLQPCDISEHD